MSKMFKINFRIEKGEDGFPPVSIETLWGEALGEGYKIDSVPFFTKDAANGDIVYTIVESDGHLWFSGRLNSSENSLIRIIFFDESYKDKIVIALRKMGCSTEFLSDYKMLAVDVPKSTPYQDVIEVIEEKSRQGVLDYEEPIIRQ